MLIGAIILGVLGGVFGLGVGLFGFGLGALDGATGKEGAGLVQVISIGLPIVSIVGGAMAKAKNVIGGVLMLVSAGGSLLMWGLGFFTVIPIVLSAIGGLLALLGGKEIPSGGFGLEAVQNETWINVGCVAAVK